MGGRAPQQQRQQHQAPPRRQLTDRAPTTIEKQKTFKKREIQTKDNTALRLTSARREQHATKNKKETKDRNSKFVYSFARGKRKEGRKEKEKR